MKLENRTPEALAERAKLMLTHAAESEREFSPGQVRAYLKRFDGAEVSPEQLERYPSWKLVTVDSAKLIPKEHWKHSEESAALGEKYVAEYASMDSIEAPPVVASRLGRISALSPKPVEGKLYVIEGHHRTVAAQRNKTPIRAFVPSGDTP